MPLMIAFSGQGLQHAAMFSSLSTNEFGYNWLIKAGEIMGIDLLDTKMLGNYCNDPNYTQSLLAILSAGAFYLLQKEINLESIILSGYSLGEVLAFSVSANLSLKEICLLTKTRATMMLDAALIAGNNKACGLAVLKGNINSQMALKLCKNYDCHLAIINDYDHYIVGGIITNLAAMLIHATSLGVIKAERLAVNLPSHTPLLSEASAKFSVYLQRFQHYPLQFPILNALTEQLVYSSPQMLPILANELSQTLHWDHVLQVAVEYDVNFFLELGSGSSLKNMFLNKYPRLKAYSLDDFSSFDGMITFLKTAF